MEFPNIFEEAVLNKHLERLDKLSNETQPQWGKMDAAQMLAHLNVAYDLDNGKIKTKYNAFTKWMIKTFVKKIVVGDKPYKKNSRTAPVFLIADKREFEKEKAALIQNMKEVQSRGVQYYEGRENTGFGKLSSKEWNNMFSKHLEHHFEQFGI
jgi:hypothetical protein